MAEDKAKAITSSKSKETTKEAQASTGLVNVKYIKDHGSMEKGTEKVMHNSTAKALAAHGVVEIGEKLEVVKKPKR